MHHSMFLTVGLITENLNSYHKGYIMQENIENTSPLKEGAVDQNKTTDYTLKVFQDRDKMLLKNSGSETDNNLKNDRLSTDFNKPSESEKKSIDPVENETPRVKEGKNEKPVDEEIKLLQDQVNETRNYARNLSRSISSKSEKVTSIINELLENGDLSEDHAKSIISNLKNEDLKKPDGLNIESDKEQVNPFQKFLNIANHDEIQNYEDYTGDTETRSKVQAFYYFLRTEATNDELQEMYDEFSAVENTPSKLTKKFIEIGDRFLKEGYGEFLKAGSFRKYVKLKNSEIANKTKDIDKLNKEKVQYKDDKPTYGFDKDSYDYSDQGQTDNSKGLSPSMKFFADRDKNLNKQSVGRR